MSSTETGILMTPLTCGECGQMIYECRKSLYDSFHSCSNVDCEQYMINGHGVETMLSGFKRMLPIISGDQKDRLSKL